MENDRFNAKYSKQAGRNEEIDRLLVEGELVTDKDGKETRTYPRSCEIASRMGVSPSWVSKYAKANQCFERRKEFRRDVEAKLRETLGHREAKRMVFDLDRMLLMCDKILERFEEAIAEHGVGRVTAADVNTIIRLRRFIEGDPDSRREVLNTSVTLESIQAAHRQLLEDLQTQTPEMTGMESATRSNRSDTAEPLAPPIEDEDSNGEIDPEIDPREMH